MRDLPKFFRAALATAARGDSTYYRWIVFLLMWVVMGVAAYSYQAAHGLGVTAMTDQVPWGAYISNFTYLVGMAAAAVMLVIPAYIYKDHALHDVVIFGELLAISALVMCLAFVMVDIGRPDRFWHMVPGLGSFNWPVSMLSWDVVVLNVYLVLNGWVATYLLFMKWRGRSPDKRLYLPFVFVSMVWAISIHTVTAFLYCGLGGRPHWHAAILAPRFLASAFASGPSLMIVALSLVRHYTPFPISDEALNRLRQIVAVAMLINLFLFAAEIFTELYPGTVHSASIRYLLFGLEGHHILVPFIWLAVALNIFAATVFVTGIFYRRHRLLMAACCSAVVGVWIEKGMGLVIPGFVPSPLGEVVEYSPSVVEFLVSAAVWAFGALLFTVLLKVAVPIELGRLSLKQHQTAN